MEVGQRSMTDRMIGAVTFDVDTYEDVEHDTTATGQAAAVVAVAAVAAAIGSAGFGFVGIIAALVSAFVGWLVWAGVTYLIGDKMLGGTATWGELLRTLGFAQAPRVLLVFAALPLLGWVVRVVVAIWVLGTGLIAIRQALDFSTGKALGTALLGWLCLELLSLAGWLL
jgi:hypothetical protein